MIGSRARSILYTIAALISLAGLADATYLTVQYLTGETAGCGGSPDCFKVLGSVYAHIGRIPVAGFGAIGYFSAFSLATFAAFGYPRARRLFIFMVWALFAATLWFLFVQAFLLHAVCRYCLFSAAVTFFAHGSDCRHPGVVMRDTRFLRYHNSSHLTKIRTAIDGEHGTFV